MEIGGVELSASFLKLLVIDSGDKMNISFVGVMVRVVEIVVDSSLLEDCVIVVVALWAVVSSVGVPVESRHSEKANQIRWQVVESCCWLDPHLARCWSQFHQE